MKNGFTLVELLIAIMILSIISSVGFVSYSQTQVVARDAKRKQDLRSIQTALELYYQKNKRYPCDSSWQKSTSNGFWIKDTGFCEPQDPFDENFINFLPKDPKKDGDPLLPNQTGYAYHMGAISGPCSKDDNPNQYYILLAGLENKNDKDSNLNKDYSDCNDQEITTNQNAFIITSQ